MVFLHALTQSKYPFISARGIGLPLSDCLLTRAVVLPRKGSARTFLLDSARARKPYKCKISPSFVPAYFASGLSASLAPILVPSAQSSESAPKETAGVRPWSLNTFLTWALLSAGDCHVSTLGSHTALWVGKGCGAPASPCTLRAFLGDGDCWKDLEQVLPKARKGIVNGGQWWREGFGKELSCLHCPGLKSPEFLFPLQGRRNKRERSYPLQSSPRGVLQCWFLERWGRSPCSRREYLIRGTLAHREELAGSRWKRLLNTAIELP